MSYYSSLVMLYHYMASTPALRRSARRSATPALRTRARPPNLKFPGHCKVNSNAHFDTFSKRRKPYTTVTVTTSIYHILP